MRPCFQEMISEAVKSADTWQFAGATDTGQIRLHNEDSLAWDEKTGLLVLADGMGGCRGGEIASALAVDTIMQAFRAAKGAPGPVAPLLAYTAVSRANQKIFEAAQQQPQYQGMGTTVALVYFCDNRATIASIGDSRVYRLRAGDLAQLTVDHTVVQEQLGRGELSPEEARYSPQRGLLTRALGVDPVAEVDVREVPVLPGDVYLLCSDGLYEMLGEREILITLSLHSGDLQAAAERLVQQANASGGYDNISVALARIDKPFPANRARGAGAAGGRT